MLELPEHPGALKSLHLHEDPMRSSGAARPVSPAFSMSEPSSVALDDALVAGDAELASFWKQQHAQFEFDYVTFRCDFAPGANSQIEKAWIKIDLECGDGLLDPATIWSMSPFLDEDLGKSSYSAKIGGEYKLFKSELGTTQEKPIKQWFVRARGEQQRNAYWEFQDNGISHIEGTHRMNLVVRRPRSQPVTGKIGVEMVVARRVFLIMKERDEVQGDPTLFHLASTGG